MKIHPLAIVSEEAKIASDVEIGAFAIVEPGATIEAGCRIEPRVSIKTGVTLGEDNIVCEGAILGGMPQHIHLEGEVGGVIIGSGNTIREHVTVHRAMYPDKFTQIGNNNLLMVNAHIAHDCIVGSHTIITNNVMLAGHVLVEDRAFVSGGVAVHQFCRVGQYAMVGGMSLVLKDVPPYVTVDGDTSLVVGLNSIGLRRAGVSGTEMRKIREAYDVLYAGIRDWNVILSELRAKFTEGMAAHFATFLEGSKRGFVQERRRGNKGLSLRMVHPEDAPKVELPDVEILRDEEEDDDQALVAI